MAGKNIKIQVWTDIYYAKFIAIWRPEEESDYVPLDPDTRPEQERNVPHLFILDSMFKGRSEVIGNNPVAPSQHPMPPEYLKQQVRHISYCFANGYGVFKPVTKAAAETFLAKQKVGYTMDKELAVTVSPVQGAISLKEFKDGLGAYTDEQLKRIKVRTLGEHPDDVKANKMEDYIHKIEGETTEQFITITKLMNVYDVADTSLNSGPLNPTVIENSHPPGTQVAPIVQGEINKTQDAIANETASAEVLKTAANMAAEAAMIKSTEATPVTPVISKDDAQQQTIKDLQAKVAMLEGKKM